MVTENLKIWCLVSNLVNLFYFFDKTIQNKVHCRIPHRCSKIRQIDFEWVRCKAIKTIMYHGRLPSAVTLLTDHDANNNNGPTRQQNPSTGSKLGKDQQFCE